jgi:GxxExxY protein
MDFDSLSKEVIGAAIEVHRQLGPGLLESAYEKCLAFELEERGCHCTRQLELPVKYKGVQLDCGYRVDLLVEDRLIVELKCVDRLLRVHEAQVLMYMKLSNAKIGLLINFNVPLLRNGIRRFVI